MGKLPKADRSRGLEAQIAFCEKMLRLLETEAPTNGKGELERPFKGWADSLRRSVVEGRGWLESCKRKESGDGTG